MPDAKQRLREQRKAIETLQEQLKALRKAEETLGKNAADALAQSLEIRQQLATLTPDILPRERSGVEALVQSLDDRINDALRGQVRTIFDKQRAHTADALRKDYLEVGLKNKTLLTRLTEALVREVEELNRASGQAGPDGRAQAQQRWQAVYDACDGKQTEIAALRKKAAAFLPPWWRRFWPVLAAGVVLLIGLVGVFALLRPPAVPRPALERLEPAEVNRGSAPLMLIMIGRDFADDAVVQWVDADNVTTTITPTIRSGDRMTVTVAADLLQRAGTARISVLNPSTNQVSSERTLVINELTPTPTPSATITPTPTPTHTPTPTLTPTPTPTAVTGELGCTLKLTTDSVTAPLGINAVTVGEPKVVRVQWSFSVIAYQSGDCGINGVSDVKKVVQRDFQFTLPGDAADQIIEPTPSVARLTQDQEKPLTVILAQDWRLKGLNADLEAGSLTLGLEYLLGNDWIKVEDKNGEPLQLVLSWNRIAVYTATPTAAPTRTRTPTPTPSFLNGTITLDGPVDGYSEILGGSFALKWTWSGAPLTGKQVFVVGYKHNNKEEKCQPEKKTECSITPVETGDYTWLVWVEDGSGHRISDQSPEQRFVVREPKATPR